MMDTKLRKWIAEDINKLIIQLLDFADKKCLCMVDEYGTKTLEGIPMELLIFTSITCITREHMKQLLQDIQLRYQEKYKQLPEVQKLWQLLYQEVKNILCIYFVEIYEDTERGDCARIIGYNMIGADRRRSSLFGIILFKFCYEIEKREVVRKELEDYIWIPTVAKVVSSMEKNIKVWENKEELNAWYEAVQQFVQEQLYDNEEAMNVVKKNIIDITNQMKYIVGGKKDAKEIFGEIQFCKAKK